MERSAPRRRISEIVKVAIVLSCWGAGMYLRFLPMPATVVGGGLFVLGTLLLAYWAGRRPRP